MGEQQGGDDEAIRDELLSLAEQFRGPAADPDIYARLNRLASGEAVRTSLLACARIIVNLAAIDRVSPSVTLGRAGLDSEVGRALAEAFTGVNMMLRAMAAGPDVLVKSALDYLADEWPGQAETPHERQKTALGVMLLFLGQRLAEGGAGGAGVAGRSTAMWN